MKILPNTQEQQIISEHYSGFLIKYVKNSKVIWTGYYSRLDWAEETVAKRKKILQKRIGKSKPTPDKIINCVEDQVQIYYSGWYWVWKDKLRTSWIKKRSYKVIYFTHKGFKQWTSYCMSLGFAKKLQDKRIKTLYKRQASKILNIPADRLRDDIDYKNYENTTKH